MDATKIAEHMEIVGSCGHHVGTVDHVEGDMIKLTKSDSADGKHKFLPLAEVAKVEHGKVITRGNHMDALGKLKDQPRA